MDTHRPDSDAHRSQIADRPMPDDVAAAFEDALGLEPRPATLGDWVDSTARRLEAAGITVGVEELCLTEESPHRVRVGEDTHHFACVLDALLVPFVFDDGPVEVETLSPVSGSAIEVTVTRDRITVDPEDAVMSLGLAADTGSPAERDGVLADGTAQFCPYIDAFADAAEYERWADETDDAVTMELPLEVGVALTSALSDRLRTDFD